MPIVKKISVSNVKTVLGYAVKNRKGYRADLEYIDPKYGRTVDSFESAGFIHSGQTLKNPTWSITKLGDEYYMDLFGKWNYYSKRISGAVNRALGRKEY